MLWNTFVADPEMGGLQGGKNVGQRSQACKQYRTNGIVRREEDLTGEWTKGKTIIITKPVCHRRAAKVFDKKKNTWGQRHCSFKPGIKGTITGAHRRNTGGGGVKEHWQALQYKLGGIKTGICKTEKKGRTDRKVKRNSLPRGRFRPSKRGDHS